MTSRSPSFLMMASSSGNSNSRGIRTALFRPFLKTLTWRSGLVLDPTAYVKHMPKEPACPPPEARDSRGVKPGRDVARILHATKTNETSGA